MRRIGYTRVSSNKPEQLKALEQHKARLKAAGCTEIHWDIASRSKHDRDGLNIVLGLIQRQQCDEAVFIRIDRMTDSPTVLERAIIVCLESGIPIKGLDDNIDFTTVGGRLHARILCDLSRAEVERLRERVMNGHNHHRDRNAAWFPIFGYKKVGDALELDYEPFVCLLDSQQELSKAAIARDLVKTFTTYRTLRKTIQVFNIRYGLHRFTTPRDRKLRGWSGFNAGGLLSWLNNPILRGHLAYGRTGNQHNEAAWDIRYNTHPEHRLLSDQEYTAIADLLRWNSEHGAAWKAKEVHPLTGLIYCAECLSSCSCQHYRSRVDVTKKTYSYQCQNYRSGACGSKRMVRQDVLEPALIDALCTRATAIADLAQTSDEPIDSPELQALRSELQFYQSAPGSRAQTIIAELQQQIAAVKLQQSAVSSQQLANRELLLSTFSDSLYWQTLQPEEKRDLYRALCDRIVIRDGAVQSVLLKV